MDNGMLADLQTAKAIEYLLAVGFLALFVPFWRWSAPRARVAAEAVLRAGAPAVAAVPATVAVSAPQPEPLGWFHVPDGYAVHPGHAWARAMGKGDVTVGIDDFAHAVIGAVQDVDMPPVGAMLRQGEPAWTLHGAMGPLPMISPVDGMVVATNPAARVGALDADPYGEGWLLRVQAPRFHSNSKQLLSGSTARAWMEDVAGRLRSAVTPDLGPAMADGGAPVHGLAGEVSPEVFQRIAREFFLLENDEPMTGPDGPSRERSGQGR